MLSYTKMLLFRWCAVLLTVSWQPLMAQTPLNHFRLYTVKDGLASNYIISLLLDSKGFLWVGTLEGIHRFDGSSFHHLPVDGQPFLAKAVTCLTQVNDSLILMGTPSGLAVFNLNSNRFQPHNIEGLLLEPGFKKTVNSVVRLPGGRCLIASGISFFLLDSNLRLIRQKQIEGLNGSVVCSTPNKPVFVNKDSTELLVGAPDIKVLNVSTFELTAVNGPFSRLQQFNTTFPAALFLTKQQGLLYAAWTVGVNYLHNNENLTLGEGTISNPIEKICQDPGDDGLYWVTSGNGLYTFNERNRRFSRFLLEGSTEIKTTLNTCRDLLFDRHQNMWVATEAGLAKFSTWQKAISPFALSPSVGGAEITHIVQDRQHRLWIASWGSNVLVAEKNGKLLRQFTEKKDKSGRLSERLFLATDTLYNATSTGTFYYDEPKQKFLPAPFYIPDSLRIGGDKLVYRDSHFNWWIGLYQRGLYRYNEANGKSYFYTRYRPSASPEYLEMLYPTAIAEDARGHLWMGRASNNATFTHWNPETETFTVIPAAVGGNTIRHFAIQSIATDGGGNVWVATNNYGVLRYHSRTGQWMQYDKSRGLKSDYILSLAVDAAGNIWAGTFHGLSVLYVGKENFITLTDEDGLPFNQIYWVGFPDKKNKDSLLVAGMDKFAWVNLPLLKRSKRVPDVLLQYVYVNNRPHFDFSHKTFPHDQSNFRFLFTAVNLLNGQDDIYAYRLRGAGKEWVELGRTQDVSFLNLAAGRYVFEVKVRNPEGVWSAPASWAFTIERPYYQQWWFYILLTIAVVAIGYSLYRYRLNRILALYQIRSRISRDLHDEVGSTLSSISFMNEMAKAKANGNATLNEKISDNLLRVQNSMQDIVWAVNPNNDDLEHLLLRFSQVAQDMLEPKGIRYNVAFPPDIEGLKLSMEHRREVYLIYKEWLNNIIKYSGCTDVDICFALKGKMMHLRIADNGKGFDATATHRGNGLKNIQERARAVRGYLHICTAVGAGAALELKVPL